MLVVPVGMEHNNRVLRMVQRGQRKVVLIIKLVSVVLPLQPLVYNMYVCVPCQKEGFFLQWTFRYLQFHFSCVRNLMLVNDNPAR